MRIGTWNKSDHWMDMFVRKRQDIEITLKDKDMGVVGLTEANIRKIDKPEDLLIDGYKLITDKGMDKKLPYWPKLLTHQDTLNDHPTPNTTS